MRTYKEIVKNYILISDKTSGFCTGLCMRVSLRRARRSQAPRIARNTRTAAPADLV